MSASSERLVGILVAAVMLSLVLLAIILEIALYLVDAAILVAWAISGLLLVTNLERLVGYVVAGVSLSLALLAIIPGVALYFVGAVILVAWAVLGLPTGRGGGESPKVLAASSQPVSPTTQKPHSEALMDELRAERWAVEEQRRRLSIVEGNTEEKTLQAAGARVGRREGRR